MHTKSKLKQQPFLLPGGTSKILATCLLASFFLCASERAIALGHLSPSKQTLAHTRAAVVIVTTYQETGKALLQGSGFFIHPDQIITGYHVIRNATSIKIETYNNHRQTVLRILAVDEINDLALLQLDSRIQGTASLEINPTEINEGLPLFVISNPRGSRWKVTYGLAGTRWNFQGQGERLQITAPIFPGCSGAPILNAEGLVVGVAAMHTPSGEDLNFAITSQSVRNLEQNAQHRLTASFADKGLPIARQ